MLSGLFTDFREKLPHLKKVIDEAQFFAIDTEFTGLNSNDATTPYDTPAEYFAKMQDNTQGYIIVQFGLTAFSVVPPPPTDVADTVDDASSASTAPPRFRYESFNFYVVPSSRKQMFRCQGESMAFLGSHNFDFNKLFRDGISYCDMIEADELRQKQSEKTPEAAVAAAAFANETTLVVPPEEMELLDGIRQSVNEFLSSDEEEITIEHCNAFRRKLVYQLVEQEFANVVFASARKLPNSIIKVIVIQRKKSEADEQQYYVDQMQQECNKLEDFIGFTTVLRLLAESVSNWVD